MICARWGDGGIISSFQDADAVSCSVIPQRERREPRKYFWVNQPARATHSYKVNHNMAAPISKRLPMRTLLRSSAVSLESCHRMSWSGEHIGDAHEANTVPAYRSSSTATEDTMLRTYNLADAIEGTEYKG